MSGEQDAPKTSGDRRPRIKLEELPRGRGHALWWSAFIIVVLGLACLVAGGLKATGNLDKPDTEAVWLAHQKDILDQTYDEYVDADERQNAVGGTLLMAVIFPITVFLAAFLCWGAVSEVVKCPKGHVVYKTYSFCPECGAQVYSKEELAPDEWRKRYELPAGPESHS